MFSTYHMATSLAAMVLIMGSFGHIAASSDVSPLEASPLEYNSGIVESRQLSGCRNSDDALDPTRVRQTNSTLLRKDFIIPQSNLMVPCLLFLIQTKSDCLVLLVHFTAKSKRQPGF